MKLRLICEMVSSEAGGSRLVMRAAEPVYRPGPQGLPERVPDENLDTWAQGAPQLCNLTLQHVRPAAAAGFVAGREYVFELKI